MPSPIPPHAPDGTERFRAVLDDLVSMAHDIARHAHAEIMATPPGTHADPEPGVTPAREPPTVAFDRMARTIRRTVLLARSLDRADRDRTLARKRVLREVEDTIGRDAETGLSHALQAELAERLDSPELEDELAARPAEDIIQDILRDLGLAHRRGYPSPWPRRTPAQAATLHARAAARPAAPGPGPAPRSLPFQPVPRPPPHPPPPR